MDSDGYFPNDFKKFSPFNLADPLLWKAMRCTDEKIYKIAKSVQQMEIEDVIDHHEGHINIIICGDHGVGKKSFKTSFNIWTTTQSEHNKLGLRV